MLLLKVVLGLCLAISSLVTESSSIKDVPNDQESMGVKMNLVLDMLSELKDTVHRQEEEILHLKETVRRQDAKITRLERSIGESTKSSEKLVGNGEKAVILRSCEEIRSADPDATSGTYWIDPDGVGSGDNPISVICDMTTGTTLVSHDSEAQVEADHCLDPGCYSRSVLYNATMRQMAALVQLSRSCRQLIRFDCFSVPFEFNNVQQAWWNDRNGDPQFYWAGDNDTAHTCQCGIDGNCVLPSLNCNCDSLANTALTDSGYITNKMALPITKLNFGRTLLETTYGRHILGKFECTGRAQGNGKPKSCEDLWRIGHTLSGYYEVQGTDAIRSVYCDFTLLPGDQGFETSIGSVDIKSSPVHFHARRTNQFAANNTVITYENLLTSVGGGMDIASGAFTAPRSGTYQFHFHGLRAPNSSMAEFLYHNGVEVSSTFSQSGSDYFPVSISSILQLKTGDKVEVWKTWGTLLDWPTHHYTNFVGTLLHEDWQFD